jgi:hypothetical protein
MEGARNIDELQQQGSMPLCELHEKQQKALDRLLTLMYTRWKISRDIFVKPEELKKRSEENVLHKSGSEDLKDQLGLKIIRNGKSHNTSTEITICITPDDKKRLQLIKGFEAEVAQELNRQYTKEGKDILPDMENRLTQFTPSGIRSVELKLLFTPDLVDPKQPVLQAGELKLEFFSGEKIRIKAEETDSLAKTMHDRFITILNSYILQEEALKTASMFKLVQDPRRNSVDGLIIELSRMNPLDHLK